MNFSKKFVSEDTTFSTYEKNVPAPLFRKSFFLKQNPEKAEILICGLGLYDLFINGVKITKGLLAPYISNTDQYIYYDYYDLKQYLHAGENVIGVMLGDGFLVGKTIVWNFKDNVMNAAPMLALTLDIIDGTESIHIAADDFRCKKGPILFNDLRSGVFYDARLYEEGWCEAGFTEIGWHEPIAVTKPRGIARICEAEPVRVYREIKPVRIWKGEIWPYKPSGQIREAYQDLSTFEKAPDYTGGYIYDFGENNTGIFRLRITGERGRKISIQCAEQLTEGKLNYDNINFYPDGFSQRDIYYLSGNGEEVFEPMFTFHGYRYLYVSGITEEQATEDLLTYLAVSSDLEQLGDFRCSDEVANRLFEMGRRSDRSNFIYFPLDCPHREKNGWTGDASVSAEHMIMTMAAEKSWREWLYSVRASQKEAGDIPGIVPTGDWGYGEGPAWDSVLFNLPYFAYKYRGDITTVKENAASMLRYLEFIATKRDAQGLINYGLGDWVPVGKEADEYDSNLCFTNGVMVVDMCRKAAEMFDAVHLPLHKSFAETLGNEMLQALRDTFIDFDTYIVKNQCQTSQAMAIFYDIFREEEKKKAFEVLLDIVHSDRDCITSGFLGLRVIFHVLARFGEADLAYEMITRKEFPSYGYWVEKGETTLLEGFWEYGERFGSSKNHHFFGDILNWFMRYCGGLNILNTKEVLVAPRFIQKLDHCQVSYRFLNGEIKIFWERKKEDIILCVNVTGDVVYQLQLENNYRIKEEKNGIYVIAAQ